MCDAKKYEKIYFNSRYKFENCFAGNLLAHF